MPLLGTVVKIGGSLLSSLLSGGKKAASEVGHTLEPGIQKAASSSRVWVMAAALAAFMSLPAETVELIGGRIFTLAMVYILAETARHIAVAICEVFQAIYGGTK